MKHQSYFVVVLVFISLASCKSSSKATANEESLKETLAEKNRQNISLLNRIRRLPNVTIKGGVPVFNKGNNSLQSNNEPLYILDDYIVGNSFRSVNGLIESVNVKKVDTLPSSDASFYGTRASSGVIKITTYQ